MSKHDESREYYGPFYRFLITRFDGRDGRTCYMVRDAEWVLDSEMPYGHTSPTVAQFDTKQEAKEWCDKVLEGVLDSIPHESNFVGWPALEKRVHAFLIRKGT